jgi:hypothetical protein
VVIALGLAVFAVEYLLAYSVRESHRTEKTAAEKAPAEKTEEDQDAE